MRANFKTMIPVLAVMATLVGAPAVAEIKVGVLDFGRLMDESPQAKRDKLVKDRATMTPDQISRAEKELRDGERDLGRRQQEINDDFNARRNEEMTKLQRTLIEEVRVFSKAQNFDLVVTDGVIYATTALDITPAVIAGMQSKATAAPKPAAR